MSQVYDGNKLRPALYSTMSYAREFYGALDSQRLQVAGLKPALDLIPGYEENYQKLKAQVFLHWLQTEDKDWTPETSYGGVFSTEYFHYTRTFLDDWPPLLWWLFHAPESTLGSAALPQFPQIRRRVCGRSIRIKALENP